MHTAPAVSNISTTSPFLKALADENNVFHRTIGSGFVYESLDNARICRNRSVHGDPNVFVHLDVPSIGDRTEAIALALRTACDHTRAAVREHHIESMVDQMLAERAGRIGQRAREDELRSRHRLRKREVELTEALQAVKSAREFSEPDLSRYNLPESLLEGYRKVVLEVSKSPVSILEETLEDVSTVFQRMPKDRRAQKELLIGFVLPRLDERREEGTGYLHKSKIAKEVLDLIIRMTIDLTALESVSSDLRSAVAQSRALLSVWTSYAKEKEEQLTKLEEDTGDLETRLKQATSGYKNAQANITKLREEKEDLRSQLAAVTSFYKASRTRAVALEDKNEHLTNHVLTLQEDMDWLRDKLAAERSSRRAAEARARSFEDENIHLRNQLASLLQRPHRNVTYLRVAATPRTSSGFSYRY